MRLQGRKHVNHFRLSRLGRALAAASVLVASAAPAQTIVVTGARVALDAERAAGDIVVIGRDRIEASAADSLEELLRREAGLQVSRSGGPGQNAGLLIRGANSAHTLVLIDGVRIGAATTGPAELEALSLAGIERIEVLRGPGSSLYGADAVGGVVQIITRRGQPGAPRVAAHAAAGGYGARAASAQFSGGAGAFDVAAGIAAERDDGASAVRPGDRFGLHNPDRDGHTRRSANLTAGWSPSAAQRVSLRWFGSKLNARYDGAEYAPPTFAPDNTPDFRNRLELRTAALEHRGDWSAQWSTLVRAADGRSDLASGGRQTDRFVTERRQLEAQATWKPLAGQSLTLAFDRLREQVRATSYAGDFARDNDAVVLAYAGSAGPLSLQAEARRDDSSVYGSVDSGRLGVAWSFAGGWKVRALAGTTFRAPSFNDLYYPGYGVPTIGPERGRSAEAGVEWRGADADVALTVYRNRVRGLIAFEPDRRHCPPAPDYDFGCARNVGRARLQGASLGGGARLGAWSLRGVVEVIDATDEQTGARLPRRAAHQETLAVDHRHGAWSAGAEVVRVGARPDFGRMLAAYTTVDLKARWRLAPQWQLEAKLLNATDRDIEPARDYQALGRQAWLGVRYGGVAR